MYLFIIILLGLILRLAYIIKPEGLWNDEYVSWMISSIPFGKGFFSGILSQCHMPLYYIYIKFFNTIGNSNDTILRISSIIPALFSIGIMYKIGITKNHFAAYSLAFITAISAFLIYYSQEVRFYSLLFMFAALSLYYLIKIVQKQSLHNIIGYIISILLILFTHTIGFVYVFFTLFYLLFTLKNKKIILAAIIPSILVALPLTAYIATSVGISQWWGEFSIRNIVFMFTDFFSPILTNNINIPSVILYRKSILFVLVLLIPTCTAVGFIINGLMRQKEARGLFYIAFNTTLILSLAAAESKFVFITKYNIEILPILMYLFVLGLSFSNLFVRYFFLSLWSIIQLMYIFTPYYPSKVPREEGNRIPAILLANSGIKTTDNIIITYYNSDRFIKYFNLNKYNVKSIDKSNISNYVSNSGKIPPNVYLRNRNFAISKIEKLIDTNKKTYVLFLDSVAFFPDDILIKISEKQEYIDKIYPLYLELSVLKNEIINYGKKHNLDVKFSKMGSWTLISIGGLSEDKK